METAIYPNAKRQGAAFIAQSSSANPRELVSQINQDHPKLSPREKFEKFREEIEDREDYQLAVDWYFFINALQYITTTRNVKPANDRSARSAMTHEERTERVDGVKQTIMRRVLTLDFVMPNGKPFRDWTFGEVAKLGREFRDLAKGRPPAQLVGAAFATDRKLLLALKA